MDAFGENWNKEFLDQIVESSLQNPSLDTATAEMDEEDDKVPPPPPAKDYKFYTVFRRCHMFFGQQRMY